MSIRYFNIEDVILPARLGGGGVTVATDGDLTANGLALTRSNRVVGVTSEVPVTADNNLVIGNKTIVMDGSGYFSLSDTIDNAYIAFVNCNINWERGADAAVVSRRPGTGSGFQIRGSGSVIAAPATSITRNAVLAYGTRFILNGTDGVRFRDAPSHCVNCTWINLNDHTMTMYLQASTDQSYQMVDCTWDNSIATGGFNVSLSSSDTVLVRPTFIAANPFGLASGTYTLEGFNLSLVPANGVFYVMNNTNTSNQGFISINPVTRIPDAALTSSVAYQFGNGLPNCKVIEMTRYLPTFFTSLARVPSAVASNIRADLSTNHDFNTAGATNSISAGLSPTTRQTTYFSEITGQFGDATVFNPFDGSTSFVGADGITVPTVGIFGATSSGDTVAGTSTATTYTNNIVLRSLFTELTGATNGTLTVSDADLRSTPSGNIEFDGFTPPDSQMAPAHITGIFNDDTTYPTAAAKETALDTAITAELVATEVRTQSLRDVLKLEHYRTNIADDQYPSVSNGVLSWPQNRSVTLGDAGSDYSITQGHIVIPGDNLDAPLATDPVTALSLSTSTNPTALVMGGGTSDVEITAPFIIDPATTATTTREVTFNSPVNGTVIVRGTGDVRLTFNGDVTHNCSVLREDVSGSLEISANTAPATGVSASTLLNGVSIAASSVPAVPAVASVAGVPAMAGGLQTDLSGAAQLRASSSYDGSSVIGVNQWGFQQDVSQTGTAILTSGTRTLPATWLDDVVILLAADGGEPAETVVPVLAIGDLVAIRIDATNWAIYELTTASSNIFGDDWGMRATLRQSLGIPGTTADVYTNRSADGATLGAESLILAADIPAVTEVIGNPEIPANTTANIAFEVGAAVAVNNTWVIPAPTSGHYAITQTINGVTTEMQRTTAFPAGPDVTGTLLDSTFNDGDSITMYVKYDSVFTTGSVQYYTSSAQTFNFNGTTEATHTFSVGLAQVPDTLISSQEDVDSNITFGVTNDVGPMDVPFSALSPYVELSSVDGSALDIPISQAIQLAARIDNTFMMFESWYRNRVTSTTPIFNYQQGFVVSVDQSKLIFGSGDRTGMTGDAQRFRIQHTVNNWQPIGTGTFAANRTGAAEVVTQITTLALVNPADITTALNQSTLATDVGDIQTTLDDIGNDVGYTSENLRSTSLGIPVAAHNSPFVDT